MTIQDIGLDKINDSILAVQKARNTLHEKWSSLSNDDRFLCAELNGALGVLAIVWEQAYNDQSSSLD
jgi:hypothetical protein